MCSILLAAVSYANSTIILVNMINIIKKISVKLRLSCLFRNFPNLYRPYFVFVFVVGILFCIILHIHNHQLLLTSIWKSWTFLRKRRLECEGTGSIQRCIGEFDDASVGWLDRWITSGSQTQYQECCHHFVYDRQIIINSQVFNQMICIYIFSYFLPFL